MKKRARYMRLCRRCGLVLVICSWATLALALTNLNRYPVGRPVPVEVYTAPFDPCDPIYKFLQTNYGEPNAPKWQAAPDDWIRAFGDNERTCLIHAISELRVVMAQQGRRILALEAYHKDPNEGKE